MMERSFDMFCYPTKKTLQNKCVCIYCFSLPKLTWQFCSGRRGHENHTLVNVQTEGAFTNYIYELIWQEREALVLYSPFFLMLAIIEYTVCNGNWSPTLIQGGGTPTLFGIHFVHWNNEAWNTVEFFPLHCILPTATDVSQSVGQFKSKAIQG